jgi:hypothetical protein
LLAFLIWAFLGKDFLSGVTFVGSSGIAALETPLRAGGRTIGEHAPKTFRSHFVQRTLRAKHVPSGAEPAIRLAGRGASDHHRSKMCPRSTFSKAIFRKR